MAEESTPKKRKGEDVDIVFLIDVTQSMQPALEAIKRNIGTFVDSIFDQTQQDNPVRDWRAKIVGYRDVTDDTAPPLEDNPFKYNNAAALKSQLERLTTKGVDKGSSSLLDAIIHLAEMDATEKGAREVDPNKWRYLRSATRIIIIFTDAPCHPTTKDGGTFDDIANHCMCQRFCLNIFAPQYPCYADELMVIDRAEYDSFEGNDGETGAEAFERFTGDPDAFKVAMEQLVRARGNNCAPPYGGPE